MPEQTTPPLVSVILTTNRGGPFLEEALASVVAQHYPRIELLVVDDAAPDRAVLHELAGRFTTLPVITTTGIGVSAARNLGASQATGEVLIFIDDDDRWHPDRVRSHVEALAANPEAVVSYCGMRTIDAAGEELVVADQRAAPSRYEVVAGRAGVMLPNLAIRTAAFWAAGGFDPAFRQGEDLDLVLKATSLGPFAFVDEVLVDYRHHGQNTTVRYRELAHGLRTILRLHQRRARESTDPELVAAYRARLRANERFAAWSAARSARAHLRAGKPLAAVGDVSWAARFAPLAPLRWAQVRLDRKGR